MGARDELYGLASLFSEEAVREQAFELVGSAHSKARHIELH